MIGYWILIGLKKNMLWGNNLQFFSPPTFVLQGDILIAYSSHMGKPTLPCCVYSETIGRGRKPEGCYPTTCFFKPIRIQYPIM